MVTRNTSSQMERFANEGCPYSQISLRQPLRLDKHHSLHEDGRKLVFTWFAQAWKRRHNKDATFEAFIFAWISVNAWAACITGEDVDWQFMRQIKSDPGLINAYQALLLRDEDFKRASDSFIRLTPIFKASDLRRNRIRSKPGQSRPDIIQHYLNNERINYEPACAGWHMSRGEDVPNDWPHVISAIYRVRCNLFHGEKSIHSEMDHEIVSKALLTLTGFFRGAGVL